MKLDLIGRTEVGHPPQIHGRVLSMAAFVLLAISVASTTQANAQTVDSGNAKVVRNTTTETMTHAAPTPDRLKPIGTMGKELAVLSGGREAELYQFDGAGCITHMWFGGSWPGYDKTRIRFYVDGESTASIDMELFMGHGIGHAEPAAPWGNEKLGKTGDPSGLYNTYKIPFGKSIRITAQCQGIEGDPPFWWIFRGVENMPVYLGNVRLPDNARLRLYKNENVTLKPLEYIDLCNSPKAGALYQVTLSAKSEKLTYLEACLRAYIDGAKEPQYISSGTEDYFLGTWYFNRGIYHNALGGCTHINEKDGTFSGYRFHEEDPIFFQKGLRYVWRNGETKFWTKEDTKAWDTRETVLYSYAWVYEW